MATSEFEEKQYENAANNEFYALNKTQFPVGQSAEKHFGYDMAIGFLGKENWIWNHIGERFRQPRVPSQLWWADFPDRLSPQIPVHFVSLFLQYKRSEYLQRNNAKQFHHWNDPYYRFEITPHQQHTLLTLEQNCTNHAAVLYSAPAFHTLQELDTHRQRQQILLNSHFSRPSRIGLNHSCYTFTKPGSHGWANPDGEKIDGDNLEGVLSSLRKIATRSYLNEHLSNILQSFNFLDSENLSDNEWVREPYESLLPRREQKTLKLISKITMLVDILGLEWCTIAFSNSD